MQEFAVLLASVAALSLTVTKVVDFLRNAFDKNSVWPRWVPNVAALVVGMIFALGWSINIAADAVRLVPALADQADKFDGVSGQILTGFIIGMAAGFWHDLLSALSGIARANNAQAVALLSETTVVPE